MLPTNVVSFMKKMVTSDGVPTQSGYAPTRSDSRDGGTTLSKLKQHLASGLTGTVTKITSTGRPSSTANVDGSISSSSSSSSAGLVHQQSTVSSEDRSLLQRVWVRGEQFDPTDAKSMPPPISTPTAPSVGVLGSSGGAASPLTSPTGGKTGEGGALPLPMRPGRPPGSSCRVCVKSLGENEFFKICNECGNKVCEDCASYSSNQSNEGEEEKWNCSVCRRRISSRAKSDKLPSMEGIPPIIPSPLPPPSPGAPAAFNLFSAMASTMAPKPQQSSSLTPNFATVSGGSGSTLDQPLANGYANYRRRSVWAVSPQKSIEKPKILERSKSKDDTKEPRSPLIGVEVRKPKEDAAETKGPTPEVRKPREDTKEPRSPGPHGEQRRPRDKSRERSQAPRRAHDDDHLRPSPRMRQRRMSDYRLHEAAAGDHLHGQTLHAARSEMDISRYRRKSCTNIQPMRPQEPPGGGRMVNGSGDESHVPEKWRIKGRKKPIHRQQSYDEDEHDKKEKESLSPWAAGEPPPRRHSMQGPTRREEALEAHKKSKASLDVPHYGRGHHGSDQEITKDSLLHGVSSGGSSRASGDNDSSEALGDRGSTSGHDDVPRSSNRRRSSYRDSRALDNEGDQGDAESIAGTSDKKGVDGSGASSSMGHHGSSRQSGSSSLEEERRDMRRRGSAQYDNPRRMQPIPASVRESYKGPPQPGPPSQPGAGRKPRITQSLEVNTSCDYGSGDGPHRQNSVNDGEAIRIVIHDVDVEHKKALEQEKGRRRVTLKRDVSDPGHRTRGLGMRVVGGKVASDGRLFAYVVWTVRGGPADTAGVVKGDKVIQWNGVELTNRSFEEVCSIMEEVNPDNDTVELLLESSNDLSLDSSDEPSALPQPTKKGSLEARSPSDPESEVLPTTSSIRRKLPQIPGDLIREPVSGKLQVQLWYDQDKSHLIATVVSAHDLRFRDSSTCYPPEAFVCLRLYPYNDCRLFSTGVAESSCKPLWNSSFIWEGLSGDLLLGLTLELTVYDYVQDGENGFLGEALIDLRHAYLDERPIWYRLQERRSRSANATPRGSIVSQDFPIPIFRRPSSARSGSEDINDGGFDSRSSSLDSGLLHPDLAWNQSRSSSRRSSTYSEQDENEEYQLGRRYPHSMPQSRRSSMSYTSNHSLEIKAEDLEARLAFSMAPVERRRSHSFRTSVGGEFLMAVEEQQRPRRASSHSILVKSSSGRSSVDPRLWKDIYVMS